MRNVIVTGASRGIGLGIAECLARSGFRVLAVARSESSELRAAANDIQREGDGEIRFAEFDLARTRDIPDFVRGLRQSAGPVYGLVNNAGIGTEGLLANMALPAIERLIAINTLAPIVMTKHATRSMIAAGEGRVINIASIVADHGYAGLSVYAATKASLVGFTRSLAREVGPMGITVNAVAPGYVKTEMTAGAPAGHLEKIAHRAALKRLAGVDDVAHAVAFLMGDKARNITGTVMAVDAGATA